MSEILTAVFHDGTFIPDQIPVLAEGSRVRLVVQPIDPARQAAIDEFDKVWDEISIDVGASKVSRDELHERD